MLNTHIEPHSEAVLNQFRKILRPETDVGSSYGQQETSS